MLTCAEHFNVAEVMERLRSYEVKDTIRRVTRTEPEVFDAYGEETHLVAVMDYGVKQNIIECLRRRGTAACTMNGANEVAVAAFLARKCAWLDIVRAIRYALEHAAFVPSPTLADYAEANAEARALAAEFLQLKN